MVKNHPKHITFGIGLAIALSIETPVGRVDIHQSFATSCRHEIKSSYTRDCDDDKGLIWSIKSIIRIRDKLSVKYVEVRDTAE